MFEYWTKQDADTECKKVLIRDEEILEIKSDDWQATNLYYSNEGEMIIIHLVKKTKKMRR